MKKSILRKLFFLVTAAILLVTMLQVQVLAAVPTAPSGLFGITLNGGTVELHWTDNSTDETGFIVQRAPDVGGLEPGPFAQIGPNPTVAANITTYTDNTVSASTGYWYRVAAVNADGNSFFSNQVRIITPRSMPQISLVTPAPPVANFSDGSNLIEASASVPGSTIATSEYQLIFNNEPGTFNAKDIYEIPMDLTILAPRAPAPADDTTAMPAGLPDGAIAEFEIRGTVAAVDSATGEWQIGTPPIIVYESVTGQPQSTRFVGSRAPRVGDAVKIMAYRTVANGPLVAKTITYIAPNQVLAAPATILSFLYNGALVSIQPPVTDIGYLISGEIWTIGAGNFRVDAPDFPAYVDPNVGIGTNVTVRFATPVVEANVARQIFRFISKAIGITTNPNPVFDTTPVPLNVPLGTWIYAIVDGVVTDLDLVTGTWTIGDEQVKCYQDANTIVAPATVGDEVLVYCRRSLTPGPLVAEQIHQILPGRLISPIKGTAVEMHLMYNGNIEAMGPNTWTVGGQTFIVDDPEGKARIDSMPFPSFAIGNPVTVEFEHIGEVVPDAGLWAPLALDANSGLWTGNLNLPALPANLDGTFFLRTTDIKQQGVTVSYPAAVTTAIAPVITTDPVDQTVDEGANVSFTAAASGDPAPVVQWQVSTDGGAIWNDIPGANSTTLSFVAAAADDGNMYRAVFSNGAGTATTNAATLTVTTVNVAPAVTLQPTDQAVMEGANVSFTAAASGTPAPTVQWQISTDNGVNWADIPGATADTYSFTAALADDGNQYQAIYTNIAGTATTNAATLTVTAISTDFTIQMCAGWNTLSTPFVLDQQNNTWGEIVAANNLSSVLIRAQYFDSATQTYQLVRDNYELKPLDAILVRLSQPGTITLTPDATTPVTGKLLNPGWNLVGLASTTDVPVTQALSSVYQVGNAQIGYSQVVSPNYCQPAWTYVRDSQVDQVMQPGNGYWVFMLNGGTLQAP